MPTRQPVDQSPIHWQCPLNINGLDGRSVEGIIDADLKQLLQPALAASGDGNVVQCDRKLGPLGFAHLTDAVEKRVHDLACFLRKVEQIVRSQGFDGNGLQFEALGGDSHHGGHRPILLRCRGQSMVLKFSDPRPHQLLHDLFIELSDGIGVDLIPPEVVADPSSQWHLMPFLEAKAGEQEHRSEQFMYNLGALTAVAYALRFVDLHLENILVSGEKPIIIDPECILYNFVKDDPSDRLLSTGLLSHNPSLSALRGGDMSRQHLVQLDVHKHSDGCVDYSKPIAAFHNRYRAEDGVLADPAEYRPAILRGFASAYFWLMKHKGLVNDILDVWVRDDFKVRYLVRKTRLYAATLHMLNLPSAWPYDAWEDYVLSQFCASGHFPEKLSSRTLDAELHDLVNRDIPYFWINAGEPYVQHMIGRCQEVPWQRSILQQAQLNIEQLSRFDLTLQTHILSDFLDLDFEAAGGDA